MLGIVIVNYRDYDRTAQFIREELTRIRIPYRLVVIDNGGSEEAARAFSQRTGCRVLPRANDGFAAGCRSGVEALDPDVDVVLFTNTDIRFASDRVVEPLIEKLTSCAEIGIIGPEIIGPDGVRQSPEPYAGLWNRYVWMYLTTPFLRPQRKRELFRLDYSAQAEEGFHYKLMGSFFLCRREDWDRCGGMDPHTFLYAEEAILSERMLRIGKKAYFLPSVTVIHEHGAVIGNHIRHRRAAWLQFESEAYYYRQYKGYSRLSVQLAGWLYRLILQLKH